MSIALVAHASTSASSGSSTTSGVDTTGATLLVANVSYYGSAGDPQLTDSYGNTWTALPIQFQTDTAGRLFYCSNPTVGTGHTFTIGMAYYSALSVAAFSGVNQLLPLDVSAEATGSSSTGNGGSVTPTNANSLVISAAAWRNPTSLSSVGSGFTITDTVNPGGVIAESLAYLIQTSATAENPTWTFGGSVNWCVSNAVFIPGSVTPPSTPAVVASVNINIPSTGAVTTSGINTTGATLLVVNLSTFGTAGNLGTVTDSKGNTWTTLTARAGSNSTTQQLVYAANPSVGSGHTFTITGSQYGSMQVAAFSGITATSPLDTSAGGTGTGDGQAGSVTPANNGSLIVAGLAYLNSSQAVVGIDSDFKIIKVDPATGAPSGTVGGAIAFLALGTAAAKNPKWNFSGTGLSWAGENAVFKPSAGGSQTVDPTAVSTGQSLGTTYIVVPGIGPTAVASRQALGTVTLTGGSVTLGPATIPTPRAVGNPNVAGPTHPGAVASQQSFGTPILDVLQGVNPYAIGSGQSFGSFGVFFVKIVNPTALASLQSIGIPAITGGVSSLLPFAILSRQSFGFPAMTGSYDGTLTVYVGGVKWGGTVLAMGGSDTAAPVTYESMNPPTITSQTLGRWTLNIDLMDSTGLYAPALGQTIALVEAGLKLFVGCIQTVGRQKMMGTSNILYHVLATDKSGICDRRIVKAITYPAGNDVAQTILSIVQNSLNGEGILTNSTSVPTDGSLGSLAADLTFNYDTVTSAFNQIATLTGTIWYVDYNGLLWFNSLTNLPSAPWGLTETSNNYRALLIEETNIDYANTIYAVSNLNVLPGSGSGGTGGGGTGTGSNTETFTLNDGNLGVIFYTSPIDGQRYPVGVNASLPVGTLYSVTVNGVAQTQIVAINEFNGQLPTSAPQYGPWLWLNPADPINGLPQNFGATGISASLLGPAGLPVGATVVINYTPFTTNAQASLGEALMPVDPATGGTLGTCGSGVYELAVQVKNVSTVSDLNAIAAAELAKRNGLPRKVTFQTDKPGLFPGMLLNINIPSMFVNNESFLIIYARGVAAPGVLEYGSRFQWEIQAQSNEDPGNWYQWFANIIQQSANGLPVYQYEDANFVLGGSGSIAGGTPAQNPYQVKRTGQLLDMFAAAGTPPTGQDLIIRFLVNGTYVPGSIKIPGGSAANTSFVVQFSLTNPLYVFNTATETDVVTITTSYSVTGANPTPAANVSATLRWRI